MKLFLHVSSHFECEKLSKKIERKTLEFMWESSAIGPSPLFLPAALLFLSYFITMYLVWQIRNSMPSWRPGGRKLRCLSWCARSSPLRTERSGWVCESAACRPSLTEERVLSGWKKEKTNENSKRKKAKEMTFKTSQKVYTNTRRAIIYLFHEYLFPIFMLPKASSFNSNGRAVCIKVIF